MRETLQLHTSGVERGQAIQSIVRTITCSDPEDHYTQRPLVELDEDVRCYQKAQISRASERTGMGSVVLMFFSVAVLFVR